MSNKQIKKLNVASYIGIIFALLCIAFTTYFAFVTIPQSILANTDQEVAKRDKKKSEDASSQSAASLKSLIEKENKELVFTDQKVKLNLSNFGDLTVTLKDKAAPENVDNFLRLTSRGFYNDTIFHRMVKGAAFNVLQGGGLKTNPQAGETAKNIALIDEIWAVKPEYAIDPNDATRQSKLVNTPVFKDPGLYPGYSIDTGLASFPKGLLMMANTGSPDSATSQFFITLDTTILPPSYTVFGVFDDIDSLDKLTKIKDEVNPVATDPAVETKDGAPDKEIKILSAEIVKN